MRFYWYERDGNKWYKMKWRWGKVDMERNGDYKGWNGDGKEQNGDDGKKWNGDGKGW